jgi:hypothetical protein
MNRTLNDRYLPKTDIQNKLNTPFSPRITSRREAQGFSGYGEEVTIIPGSTSGKIKK